MAEMLKTVPLLFGLPTTAGAGWDAQHDADASRERRPASAKSADSQKKDLQRAEPHSLLSRALQSGGQRLLLRHFLAELDKLLSEQETVLRLLEQSRPWSLSVLNRQFYAIRSAAAGLGLRNLSQVAGRAEVLVNLLDGGSLIYNTNHGTVLVETHRLLRALVARLSDSASDANCYSIAQTVWSLHAALEGNVCAYEPGDDEHSVAQSTRDGDCG
jgi:hypothetical protein